MEGVLECNPIIHFGLPVCHPSPRPAVRACCQNLDRYRSPLYTIATTLVETANHRGGAAFINPGRLRAGYYCLRMPLKNGGQEATGKWGEGMHTMPTTPSDAQ